MTDTASMTFATTAVLDDAKAFDLATSTGGWTASKGCSRYTRANDGRKGIHSRFPAPAVVESRVCDRE